MTEPVEDEKKAELYLKLKSCNKVLLTPYLYMDIIRDSWSNCKNNKNHENLFVVGSLQNIIKYIPNINNNCDISFIILLSIFHFEMMYGYIEPPLKDSLKKIYWYISEKIKEKKLRVPICKEPYRDIIKFMLGELNRTVMFKENFMLNLCSCVYVLYGDYMINRISLIAHDESYFYSNWAVRTEIEYSIESSEIYSEIVKRQLRICDILLYAFNGLIILFSYIKKNSSNHICIEHLKTLYIIAFIFQKDLDNLISSFSYLIARSISVFAFSEIAHDSYANFLVSWTEFSKPLSLIQSRVKTINDQLRVWLPFDWSYTNSEMIVTKVNPISKVLISLLAKLHAADWDVFKQIKIIHDLEPTQNIETSTKTILNDSQSILTPFEAYKELEVLINADSNDNTSVSNFMVAAFDSDFNELLIQARTSPKSFDRINYTKKNCIEKEEPLQQLKSVTVRKNSNMEPMVKFEPKKGFTDNTNIMETKREDTFEEKKDLERIKPLISNNSVYDWEISIKDLIIENQIGAGATSIVHKGIWHGTEVAIKKMTSSLVDPQEMLKYKQEIQILFKLRHPNLTLFMGASIRQEPYFVVMEFCEGGDLFSFLHIPNSTPHAIQNLSIQQMLKIATDIAKGMAYLHNLSPQVIHRDLKSLNILLSKVLRSPYDEPLAKISDFGLSQLREVNSTSMYYTRSSVGTCHWMAPEVLLAQPYDESIDVYSYGVLLYEIFSRSIPYSNQNPINVAAAVSQGQRPNLQDIPQNIPDSILSLIEICWHQDSRKRPTFPQILHILRSISS